MATAEVVLRDLAVIARAVNALAAIRRIVDEYDVEPSVYSSGDDRSLGNAEGKYELAKRIREAITQ